MTEAANEFRLDPVQIQAIIDRLEENDPEGFAEVAVDDPDGADTLLIRFQVLTGDQDRAGRMVEDIQGLWFGDEREVTATSVEVVGLEVVTAMTDSQTVSIIMTILATLIILVIFFWITLGRPALGFIAVGPIVCWCCCGCWEQWRCWEFRTTSSPRYPSESALTTPSI